MKRFLKTTQIKLPTLTAYNADAFATATLHATVYNGWGITDITTNDANNISRSRINRGLHRDAANLNFIDGHCEKLKRMQARAMGNRLWDRERVMNQ